MDHRSKWIDQQSEVRTEKLFSKLPTYEKKNYPMGLIILSYFQDIFKSNNTAKWSISTGFFVVRTQSLTHSNTFNRLSPLLTRTGQIRMKVKCIFIHILSITNIFCVFDVITLTHRWLFNLLPQSILIKNKLCRNKRSRFLFCLWYGGYVFPLYKQKTNTFIS